MGTSYSEVRMEAALKLLRYKMLKEVASSKTPMLDVEDINEVFVAADMPVIIPGETDKKELEVIA